MNATITVTVGTKFTSTLNPIFSYEIIKDGSRSFFVQATKIETGKKSDRLIGLDKTQANYDFNNNIYMIIN